MSPSAFIDPAATSSPYSRRLHATSCDGMISPHRRPSDGQTCSAQHLEILRNGGSASLEPRAQQLMVQVLIDGKRGPESRATVPVSGGDTIRQLKMTLSQKSWFTSKHCLFFGERELLDHQSVADIIAQVHASGNTNYLHVFVRTQDVKSGKLSTSRSSVSFGSLAHLDAQHSAPAALESAAAFSSSSSTSALAPVASDSTVLHIVIRKNAHVSWQPTNDGAFELLVKATETPAQVKQKLLPSSDLDCPSIFADANLVHNGVHMEADRPLLEYGLSDGDVLELVPWEPIKARLPEQARLQEGPLVPELSSPTHDLYKNWQLAASGLRAGIAPDLAPAGTGGSYFLRDTARNVVAIFKPLDEEPNMRNNPRGFTPASSPHDDVEPASLRRGIRPGEGAHREVAAYLLDHGHRAGVPATAPVFVTYPDGSSKYGSLQQFVKSDSDCEELGYGNFSVEQVHKIAVLDLRLANADRNGANILARRDEHGQWILTPIDHGCCLPDKWQDMSFEWSFWRQAQVPFDEDTTHFIANLDPDQDLELLRERGIPVRPECARIFKAAALVLKKCASRGLSPKHASDIMERNTMRKSIMEKMHKVACDRAVREEDADECNRLALVVPRSSASTPRHSGAGAGHAHAVPESDAVYLRHLGLLLDEYLEDVDFA